MKARLIYFLAAALSTASLSSCESLLDLKPEASIPAEDALNTVSNLNAAMLGTYKIVADPYLYGSRLIMNAELLGDGGDIGFLGTYDQNRQFHRKTVNTVNPDVRLLWSTAYQGINSCNIIISKAETLTDKTAQAKLKGQALFLRSMLYFDLVRAFGKQYEAGTANTPGVPLILKPTLASTDIKFAARNTVGQVYAQVIADLKQAATLLDGTQTDGRYATTDAANALLARVYLQQGDYKNARDMANTVIEAGNYNLVGKYEDVFNKSANTSEDILAIQSTKQDNNNGISVFYGAFYLGGRGDIEMRQQHLDRYEFVEMTAERDFVVGPAEENLYEEPNNYDAAIAPGSTIEAGATYYVADARFGQFYDDAGTIHTGKWYNLLDGTVPLIRLSEMYLIRAEANFMLGQKVGASPAADLNMLRERVGLPAIEEADLTIGHIKRERRVELAHEGHAIHDVKRWKESLKQGDATFLYNSSKLVLPIPQRELDITPELGQNEGY